MVEACPGTCATKQQIEGYEQSASDKIQPVVARLGYVSGMYEPSKTLIAVPDVIAIINGAMFLLWIEEKRRFDRKVCGRGGWV